MIEIFRRIVHSVGRAVYRSRGRKTRKKEAGHRAKEKPRSLARTAQKHSSKTVTRLRTARPRLGRVEESTAFNQRRTSGGTRERVAPRVSSHAARRTTHSTTRSCAPRLSSSESRGEARGNRGRTICRTAKQINRVACERTHVFVFKRSPFSRTGIS